jgi:hypothetical protein
MSPRVRLSCAILAAALPAACQAPPPGAAGNAASLAAREAATSDAPAIDACWRAVLASPPHVALRHRTGDHADSPSPLQKQSRDRASVGETVLLATLQRDYVAPCRQLALASAARVHPTILAVLRDSYAQADANLARLQTGVITWGEYVSESQAIVTNRRAELLAAGEALQRAAASPPGR